MEYKSMSEDKKEVKTFVKVMKRHYWIYVVKR